MFSRDYMNGEDCFYQVNEGIKIKKCEQNEAD